MTDPLHARLPVTSLVNNSEVIEISAKVGDFSRLAAAIEADLAAETDARAPDDWREKRVSGRLEFGAEAAGEAVVAVCLAAEMTSVCQRSLDVFEWQLETELKLRLVRTDGADAELEGYETWELDDDVVVPIELADEALVMALPLSVRREEEIVEVDTPAAAEELTTPFADLRAQMDKAKD